MSDHFCSRLSLIARWPEADCRACSGQADAAELATLKHAARYGGSRESYLALRVKRLSQLVYFKSGRDPRADISPREYPS